MAGLLLEKLRRKAWNSLYVFDKYVLGYEDMAPQPHWELCDFIQRNGHRDCLILLPRGTFKSTCITVGWVMWQLWHNPNLRFLITGGELGNSKRFLGVIRDHCEQNEVFRWVCGNWVPDRETWHSEALHIAPRTNVGQAQDSVTASSVSTTKVSQHFDRAVIDDLVTDKTVMTKGGVEKAEDYLNLLLPILDPQSPGSVDPGPRIVIGTRWSHVDVYARIIARDRLLTQDGRPARFAKLIRGAHNEAKTWWYFPTRFNEEYLNRLKEESGLTPYQYACQFLNNPTAEGDQPFKLSDFRFYHEKDLPPGLTTFTTIDPAIGQTDRSDRTAIVTVSFDVDGNWYIRECKVGRWLPDRIIDELFDTWLRLHPHRVGLEDVALQFALGLQLRKIMLERGHYISVVPLKPPTNKTKEMRIYGLSPYFVQRKIHFPADERIATNQDKELLINSLTGGMYVLAEQAVRYPLVGDDDDAIDALAYIPQLAFPPARPKVDTKPGARTFAEIRERLMRRRRGR